MSYIICLIWKFVKDLEETRTDIRDRGQDTVADS